MADLKLNKVERPVTHIMLDRMIDNLLGEGASQIASERDLEELEVVSDAKDIALSEEEVARIEASLRKSRCEEEAINHTNCLDLYTEQR